MGRAPIKTLPGKEELDRLFSYDPETGALSWKVQINRAWHARPGTAAGTTTMRGYLQVGISGVYYLVHRIIWKMMTGEDPTDQIDHVDGDRKNNKWANLRAADASQNMSNRKVGRNNNSGIKGVCWDRYHKAWVAYIGIGGEQKRLGRFKSIEEAAAARQEASARSHGEFARAA